TLLASLSLLALASGCAESKGTAKPEPAIQTANAGSTTSADPDVKLPKNQRLALAKVSGSSNADKALIEAQSAARANVAKDDLWITLGRAWIKKARESADPGFYLNADACAD